MRVSISPVDYQRASGGKEVRCQGRRQAIDVGVMMAAAFDDSDVAKDLQLSRHGRWGEADDPQ